MVVIDQVLVVSKRVGGFHVTMRNAVTVAECLKHRGNAVGGTRCRGKHLIVGSHAVFVDAEDDVRDIAFARRGQHDTVGTFGLQVLRQALTITPCAGVVDDNGVVDAVGGVVDFLWRVGVDDLDLGAVCPDDAVFFIHGNGAVEFAMHGITAQQRGTFDDVTFTLRANHDGTQTYTAIGCFALDENACEQTTNTAKTIKHDVGGFFHIRAATNDFFQFGMQVVRKISDTGLRKPNGQAPDVDRCGTQIH